MQMVYADVTYKNSGSLDYSLTNMNNKNVNMVDVIINNDFYIGDNTKIVFSPGVLTDDRGTYNSIVKSNVNKISEVYINELYVSYLLTDNLSIAVGVFPFRKGAFYEYGFNGYRAGNGLYSITDNVLQGFVVSYTLADTVFQIGTVSYQKFFKSSHDYDEKASPITYDSYKGSGMDYFAIKQNLGKWYLDLEVANVYQYMNTVDVIDSNVYSLGVSYDESVTTGRTYYAIASWSQSKGDTGSLAYTYDYSYGVYSPMYKPDPDGGQPEPPNGSQPFHNDSAQYDSFKTSGYFALIGVKQEIDNVIFGKDLVLSAEYAYRSGGYHSLLAGRPLSPHAYADIGNFYNLSAGVRIDKNNMIKLRYYMYDTNGASTKYGFTPVTTDATNVNGALTRYQAIILQWYYDF